MNSGLDGRADECGWETAAVVKRSGNSAAEGESDEGTLAGNERRAEGERRRGQKKESVEQEGRNMTSSSNATFQSVSAFRESYCGSHFLGPQNLRQAE